MGDRLSARELVEWVAYAQRRPFGEEQADRRTALIAHVVAAAAAGKKAPEAEKFLAALRPDPPKPEQGPEDLRTRMLALASRTGKGKRPTTKEPDGDAG